MSLAESTVDVTPAGLNPHTRASSRCPNRRLGMAAISVTG